LLCWFWRHRPDHEFFKRVNPNLEMVLADPVGSNPTEYVETGKLNEVSGSRAVEGIGEYFHPSIAAFKQCEARIQHYRS